MALYLIANGPSPTIAAQVPVTTGTVIKTLLQIEPSATNPLVIVEWGISFDGSAAGTPIRCELLETDVAATVTASAQADIVKFDGLALAQTGNQTTNIIQIGTANTGYTASAEGTITVVRIFDVQFVAPSNGYYKQFPLGREPVVQVGKFARIRVTAPAAVNAYAYAVVQA